MLGATAQRLENRAHETEREEKRVGEETGADRSAPLGSEREREGCQATRARGRAAWLGRAGLVWAAFPFSFSLDFLIPFLFLFYRVFNSKFKLGFKFK
jgi:hypothetical protein